MHTIIRTICIVTLLFVVALSQGCGGKESDPTKVGKGGNTDQSPDVGGHFATPPKNPPPPKKQVDAATREQDIKLLKDAGLSILALGNDMNVSVNNENLTEDGRIKPKVLAALKKAKTLDDLSFQFATDFTDAGLAEINDLTNLRELLLHGTKITDAGLENLKGMTKLTKLYLSSTPITDKGLAHLKGLPNLTELDLGNPFGTQNVTEKGLGHLQLGKLTRLQIRGSKITDAGLALLRDSKDLRVLWAGNCDITDKGLEHLKSCSNMSWLDLHGTKVTDAGLAHLKGMSNLFSLTLDDCKGVGDPGLAHLEGLTKLFTLNVKRTGVTKAGAEGLHAKLPKCTIIGQGWKVEGK